LITSSGSQQTELLISHRLEKALEEEVKEHGWSNTALERAARKMGLSPAVTGLLSRCDVEVLV
jgi:ubiquinone biosynthesis protein COQ9